MTQVMSNGSWVLLHDSSRLGETVKVGHRRARPECGKCDDTQ